MKVFLLAVILALAPAEAGGALRIASFNLEWLTASASETRMAPWKNEAELEAHRRDLARILANDVHADIVCLLEATSRAALDKLVAEPALRKSGYRILHIESGDIGTGQDVAFLVSPRVKLDKFNGAEIRRFADTLVGRPRDMRPKDPRGQRLTKHALICLSSPIKFCLLGVHLLAHPDDKGRTRKREVQARIMAGILRNEVAAKGYAAMALGDFNDFDPDVTPDSGMDRRVFRLVKNFDPSRMGPELLNVAQKIQPISERYSAYWDKNKNGHRDAGESISLIDHILLDKTLAKRLGRVEILHAAQDGSVSDHWPVVVEIK